jgi:NAD(P)-dependent dehydrogenase (short-subunit alcohol dehydrogenase family)
MITGASGGLGRAVAEELARDGRQLALVTRHVSRLVRHPGQQQVYWIEADVSTAEGAQRAVEQCTALTGQTPEALVNCAGSVFLKPLHRTTTQQYRDCVSANLDTGFYSLQAFVAGCLGARQAGVAVLVSSVTARIGVSNHEAIAASKAAIEGLVRSAAATYARHQVRVNAVAPGLMRTPATEGLFSAPDAVRQLDAQYPLGRHGQISDVARAIAWLLSSEAAWITGQTLAVDGGFSAVRPLQRTG